MKLVPLSYNVRGLWVRRASTFLTVLSIGATVAILAGVLALQQGFSSLFSESGREDVYIFLRRGSGSEGLSGISRNGMNVITKNLVEIARDEDGQPLAAAESFLGVRLQKTGGAGETNVPIRGVQPESFELLGDAFRMVEGERFQPGTDQIIVGEKLVARIENCRLGDVLMLNTTPFEVVGVFAGGGPESSEIWIDIDRMMEALERPVFNRVVARLAPGTDLEAFREKMLEHPQQTATVQSEREYLAAQSGALTGLLGFMAFFLGSIMGTAAVFTAINTMLSALAARTKEIGILISIGYRPLAVFLSFLLEAVLLGLIGGVIGCLIVLPLNGIETGASNFDTFTEVAFAFRFTPAVLLTAVIFAMLLGLVGGAWPAFKASRLRPTEALRR